MTPPVPIPLTDGFVAPAYDSGSLAAVLPAAAGALESATRGLGRAPALAVVDAPRVRHGRES
jgi:hypothetical protein